MSKDWKNIHNILCIRPDNMCDVIMTQPAMRAIKDTYPEIRITLLTSQVGAKVSPYIPEIDETLAFDFPWVKTQDDTSKNLPHLIQLLTIKSFDASVVFTNFSQSPHPSIVISLLAGIPKRLAYSRENVYHLLTDWVTDTEPFTPLVHGVERNLKLVEAIGARTKNNNLSLKVPSENFQNLLSILYQTNLDLTKPWIIIHPGVEDEKRQFPIGRIAETARLLMDKGYQIVLTGTEKDNNKIHHIQQLVQKKAIDLGDRLALGEFLALLRISPLVIANNTGVIHMAAALNTPIVVFYARTNPEHTPWNVTSSIFYFDIPSQLRSRTPILSYISPQDHIALPKATEIVDEAISLLSSNPQRKNFQFL